MDTILAEMVGNMIDSVHDEEEMQQHMKKRCPTCNSDDTIFDRHLGTYECWSCIKSFC
jgi:ribosomal protein S27E